MTQFCQSTLNDSNDAATASSVSRSFSDNALKAAQACYGQPGLKGLLKLDNAMTRFVVSLRYIRDPNTGDGDYPNLTLVNVSPASAVKGCDSKCLKKQLGRVNTNCQSDA